MLINIIKDCYSWEEAKAIVKNTDKRVSMVQMSEVYYPYYRMRYNIIVGNKAWNKLNKLSDCVVDLVDGRVAESRGEPVYGQIEIDPKDALEVVISTEQCYQKGHDFVLKLYLNKAKLLHTPAMDIISEERFYKKFYIVQCKDREDIDYFLMVDSVEGEISILDV